MQKDVLNRLGIKESNPGVYARTWTGGNGESFESINPSTGTPIARIIGSSPEDYTRAVESAVRAFNNWRAIPAPQRGDIVREIGQVLRAHKSDLGLLVTLEVGKPISEGEGEVQEMIDMCDFAVGLSRQLYGLTMPSERAAHRLSEQWHPLGSVGIITAFNFPVAVWAWNAALAAVCGNTMIWKPSPSAPLTAIAVHHLVDQVMAERGFGGVFNLCISADASVGRWMAEQRQLPLISATGSCTMGRSVAQSVGARLGRSLLELGGNNAIIISETADLDLALRGVLFAAVGTSGQRCTTLRRLILHESIAESFLEQLVRAYESIAIGDPWEKGVLMGPLISETAIEAMMRALEVALEQGGDVLCGGKRLDRAGFFVEPTIVRATPDMPIVREETFAPILYAMTYADFDEAIALQNNVDQGLSSAIFTTQLTEAERFLSINGSDCGIANVNIGTSGAEIGGAFGGEKDTGGGREAGSDAWKSYMRRQTCTVNFGGDLPLAQGVRFDLPGPSG